MRSMGTTLGAGLALAVVGIAGCKISASDDGSSSTATSSSVVGVWSGADSATGLGVVAVINSAEEAVFIRSDGVQFAGTVQVSGETLAGTVDGYSNFPSTFSDGSNFGIGTVNGTVTSTTTFSAGLSFTTGDSNPIAGEWAVTAASFPNGFALTSLGGDYTDTVTGNAVKITTGGAISGENTGNGCIMTGTLSTTDSSVNVYQVAYSFASCTGTYGVLNGIKFTGLGFANTNASPVQLVFAVTGSTTSSGSTLDYGLVSYLNHN
jgi:hypothetical protein